MAKYVIDIDEELYDEIQDKLDFNGDLSRGKIRDLMLVIDSATPLKQEFEDIKAEIKEYKYGNEELSETDKGRAEAYNFGLEKTLEIIDNYINGKE